jgi:hypothetical protein
MRFFTINLIKDILQYISSSDDPTIIHIPKIVSEVNGTLNGEERKGNRRPTTTQSGKLYYFHNQILGISFDSTECGRDFCIWNFRTKMNINYIKIKNVQKYMFSQLTF